MCAPRSLLAALPGSPQAALAGRGGGAHIVSIQLMSTLSSPAVQSLPSGKSQLVIYMKRETEYLQSLVCGPRKTNV